MKVKQSIPKELRFTIEDFNRRFPTDSDCLDALMQMRFPGCITYCPKCEQDRRHYRITGRPVYGCGFCGTQVSPMAGTIFEHSSTSLRLWFYAMYLMASTRCGISAKQIQRETGVTYKTAWRMFKQLRSLLSEPDMQLGGLSVEMDETGIGGTTQRKGQPKRDKTTVFGMVERGGRVKAVVADNRKKDTLMPIIKEYVLPESTVFTDDFSSYVDLGHHANDYRHHRINHSAGVYVMGDVHTQTIEGFWGLIKTGIRGVYHSVSTKYLQTYLDEYSFRYNRRHKGNLIFNDVLERVSERSFERPSAKSRQMQSD